MTYPEKINKMQKKKTEECKCHCHCDPPHSVPVLGECKHCSAPQAEGIAEEDRWETELHKIRVGSCECRYCVPSQDLLQFISNLLISQRKQFRQRVEEIKGVYVFPDDSKEFLKALDDLENL